LRVLAVLTGPGYAAEAELCDDLEPPPGDFVVFPVSAVRVVVVEDGEDGFGSAIGDAFGADVESGVGVARDDLDAITPKGSTTFAE
jgi:hypothetical protein